MSGGHDRKAFYSFVIPAQGIEHISEILYFKIEATDMDNDRDNDALSSVDDNNGNYYAISIGDSDIPTLEQLSLANGDVLEEGDVTIDATVSDPSGSVTATVKINDQVSARPMPPILFRELFRRLNSRCSPIPKAISIRAIWMKWASRSPIISSLTRPNPEGPRRRPAII